MVSDVIDELTQIFDSLVKFETGLSFTIDFLSLLLSFDRWTCALRTTINIRISHRWKDVEEMIEFIKLIELLDDILLICEKYRAYSEVLATYAFRDKIVSSNHFFSLRKLICDFSQSTLPCFMIRVGSLIKKSIQSICKKMHTKKFRSLWDLETIQHVFKGCEEGQALVLQRVRVVVTVLINTYLESNFVGDKDDWIRTLQVEKLDEALRDVVDCLSEFKSSFSNLLDGAVLVDRRPVLKADAILRLLIGETGGDHSLHLLTLHERQRVLQELQARGLRGSDDSCCSYGPSSFAALCQLLFGMKDSAKVHASMTSPSYSESQLILAL